MTRSIWKLHLDSSSDESAKKVTNKCIRAFGRLPIESNIEKYYKGGYMTTLCFYHDDNLSWSEIVVEVIGFAQKLGSGWSLIGDINTDSEAVLSKDASGHFNHPGLKWAQWQVSNG